MTHKKSEEQLFAILQLLTEKNDFVSGEYIGELFGLTRAAIWKDIEKLRGLGYEITSQTRLGYRLDSSLHAFHRDVILKNLQTKQLGQNTIFFDKTDSTNDQLKLHARKGAEEGTLAVAELMTKGKGRRGRSWFANRGDGIWLSLLLRPQIPPQDASMLTLLSAIALSSAIEETTGLVTDIKWPNDILYEGKKLCGILTEMDCEMEQINFIVLGIGINVNTKTSDFPEELQETATSLSVILDKKIPRTPLLQNFLMEFEQLYLEFLRKKKGLQPFLERYNARCTTLGKDISVLGNGEAPFFAKAISITEKGELTVKREDTGEETVVFAGEVSIRRN
ncbi:MAG: biotin--[acetyl-CoA-carboxylase] ligase [Bacillota bacterium]